MKPKRKFLDLKPFKNKKTGQLSIVIPKKKIKLIKDKHGCVWVRVKVK